MKRSEIKIGMEVRVKGHQGSARVLHVLRDIPDGVILNKPIGMFRYWNVSDLEPRIRTIKEVKQ